MFAEALAAAQTEIVGRIERLVEAELEEEIEEVLRRAAYARRGGVGPWVEIAGQCQRCKSRQSRRSGWMCPSLALT
ncbi:MAG: hypothetical protein IT329_21815 [Caldilineaceae bacterium]|nr:hypothetical protein [Caldilineaceae bacterium]